MSRDLLVLYGSQTGCAREVSKRIAREARRLYFNVTLCAMDSFNINKLPAAGLAVFICSTTGQGETPDNMKKFWRFLLRKDLPAHALSRLHFSTFGLGDSSYPIYNAVARRLHERLLSLGAHELCVRGLGDDQHQLGYDGGLVPWLDIFRQALLAHTPLPEGVVINPDLLSNPQLLVSVLPAEDCDGDDDLPPALPDLSPNDPYHSCPTQPLHPHGDGDTRYTPTALPLLSNTRLTPDDHHQDVRHLRFDLSSLPNEQQRYLPGDVLHVHPPTPRPLVDAALKLWRLHPNDCIFVKSVVAGADSGFPSVVRAWELFTWYLDLAATPQRYIFEVMAQLATDPAERERLTDLISPDYADTLHQYCARERRSFIEVAWDFPSARLPLPWALELVPRISPRAFSICSAADMQLSPAKALVPTDVPCSPIPALLPPTTAVVDSLSMSTSVPRAEAHLCVAVLDYRTPYRRRKLGLCSGYLRGLGSARADDAEVIGYTINCPGLGSSSSSGGTNNGITSVSGCGSTTEGAASTLLPVSATTLLSSSNLYPRVFAAVRPGSFRMRSHTAPLVLVGPGTGIAAFAAYTQHMLAAHFAHALQSRAQTHTLDTRAQTEESSSGTSTDSGNAGSCGAAAALTAELVEGSTEAKMRDDEPVPSSNVSSDSVPCGDVLQPCRVLGPSSTAEHIVCIQHTNTTSTSTTSSSTLVPTSVSTPLSSAATTLPPVHVFFGCRARGKDDYYRDMFSLAVRAGVLKEYHCVYSRERGAATDAELAAAAEDVETIKTVGTAEIEASMNAGVSVDELLRRAFAPSSATLVDPSAAAAPGAVCAGSAAAREDKYVQDRMRRGPVARSLYRALVEQRGTLIVAGSAGQMPRDVKKTLLAIIEALHPRADGSVGVSEEEAAAVLEQMVREGRYMLECWS